MSTAIIDIATVNPATNEVIQAFEEHSEEFVKTALGKADKCFAQYRQLTFADRSALMNKAAEILKGRKQELAAIITLEMGKPIKEAVAEIEKCAWVCEYYAEHAETFLRPKKVEGSGSKNYVRYDPLGIILGIMPWNFPYWQVFRFAVPTLMAGNVCLLKHASNVPQSALKIEEIFSEAGFPEGAFQTLLIRASKVNDLLKDDRIKGVSLTGSEGAGSKVAEAAGRNLKRSVLELGGSDPFVVMEDADLEEAAKVAVQSRMMNAGQSCIAAKRFIVHQNIADEFTKLVKAAIEKLKVGDPTLEDTEMGPLARQDLVDDLEKQVNESVSKGAKILTGGKRSNLKGAYFEPTLLVNITKEMPVYTQEVFGPVASIISFSNLDEAIDIANDTSYGLGASLWTSDTAKAEEIAARIEAGNVFFNGLVKSDPRMPFGGIKNSGYGRELSEEGIKEFVNQKTVWVK